MFGYVELSDEIMNAVKSYIKKGEIVKISGEIELNGKYYREVVFSKRNLKSLKNHQQGYLYIDGNNEIVSSKNINRELAKLAHFYEIFFSGEKGLGILAALQAEGEQVTERAHSEEIVQGLDFLYGEGVSEAQKVKEVIKRLPASRERTNSKVNELYLLVNDIKEKNLIFNEELLQKLYQVYEDILKLNFEKVKLIGTLSDCCDFVKEQAEKKRKKWAVRFTKKVVGPLLRASDEISYFKRVIRTYANVLNMTTSQYIKFLNNMNKEKIEARANLVRI
jgi:hypothetical protein